MTFKETIYRRCMEIISEKINVQKNTLQDLRESASNETKSTAGDKHETALAMLQIEQKNTGQQLDHLLSQKKVLERLVPTRLMHKTIANGSLVKTNKGMFFLAIPLGKIHVEGTQVTVLSAQSPLGSQLLTLGAGTTITVNGQSYDIEAIE